MADNIVYRFSEMRSAADAIDGYASDYGTAADTLIESLLSAVASWEGESKDKFVAFVNGTVREFAKDSVPQLVTVVAQQIQMSAENMEKTDADRAANIPS